MSELLLCYHPWYLALTKGKMLNYKILFWTLILLMLYKRKLYEGETKNE